jgi:outer membrane beta-barrel protein
VTVRSLVGVLLLFSSTAFGQLSSLENPGSVSAIQQRAYRMQHEIDISLGILPLDAFYKSLYAQASYTAHFTDAFAWQVARFGYSYNLRTGLREQLERDFGVLPTQFEEVQYFVGSDVMLKPLYGKMALLNRFLIHGEIFLMAGVTVFKFTNNFRPAVNLGGGGRVFFTNHISLRLDLTNNIVIPTGGSAIGLSNVMAVTLSLGINFGASE